MTCRPRTILWAFFAFTYLFFIEYMPPFQKAHLPYDLGGYHLPISDYAFQNLKEGHFPQWDPSNYCGMSFTANTNVALFYPPMWLLFAGELILNPMNDHLTYQGFEDFVFAHVWLGFTLCFFWLRNRKLDDTACLLGAGIFAFSGYVCTQLQHLGLVAAYAWIPLALWGVDDLRNGKHWTSVWKIILGSALSFLAGYPPTWVAIAIAIGCYALIGSKSVKTTSWTVAAVIFSLGLCAVQILPSMEASKLLAPDPRYGHGLWNPWFLVAYFTPNYFDFALKAPQPWPPYDYFWLGAPAILGLAFLFRRKNVRDILPILGMFAGVLFFVINPFNLVWSVIKHSNLLSTVFRDWYFLAGVTPSIAALAAYGIDDFLKRPGFRTPSWLIWLGGVSTAMWVAFDLVRWFREARSGVAAFPAGWWTLIDVLIAMAAFGLGILALRSLDGRLKTTFGLAFVICVGLDYKAFGTFKRFDANAGRGPRYVSNSFDGIDPKAMAQLQAEPHYRVLLDQTGPFPGELRHVGLTTPQGFDPFLSSQLREVVDKYGKFQTDRTFDLDTENDAGMQLFGVRYLLTTAGSPLYAKYQSNPKLKMLGSEYSYFKAFEYTDAKPVYGWEPEAPAKIEVTSWEPEIRGFKVQSSAAGRVTLSEQLFPGWSAVVDGQAAQVERWNGAFQAVAVPAGEHTVEFRFQSKALKLGAEISFIFLAVFLVLLSRSDIKRAL